MVRGVLRIAEELQVTAIAEGVEDAAHELELRRLGCTHAQGYLYSRPCPAKRINELLADRDLALGGAA